MYEEVLRLRELNRTSQCTGAICPDTSRLYFIASIPDRAFLSRDHHTSLHYPQQHEHETRRHIDPISRALQMGYGPHAEWPSPLSAVAIDTLRRCVRREWGASSFYHAILRRPFSRTWRGGGTAALFFPAQWKSAPRVDNRFPGRAPRYVHTPSSSGDRGSPSLY